MAGKSTVKTKRTEQNDPTVYTDLSALHYRGAWVGANSYAVNDTVIYNNRLYRFTTAVPAPGSLTYLGGSVKLATNATTAIGQVTLPAGCAVGDIAYVHVMINNGANVTTTAVLRAPTGSTGAATQIWAQAQTQGGFYVVNALYGYPLTATDLTNGFITIPVQGATGNGSAQHRAELMVLRGATLTLTGSATATAAGTANMALTLPSVTPSASSVLAIYLTGQSNWTTSTGAQNITMTPSVNQILANVTSGNGTNGWSSMSYLNITSLSAAPSEAFTGGSFSTSSGLAAVTGATLTLAVDPNAAGVWDASKVVEIAAVHDSINGTLQAADPVNANDVATRSYTDSGDMTAQNYAASLWADTLNQTSGIITATSPHTLNSQSVRKVGKIVQIHFSITLGAAINVPSTGDIGNTEVATVPAGYLPLNTVGLCNGNAGINCHGIIGTNGSIQITNVPPGTVLSSGVNFTLAGTYLAA